MNFTDEHFRRIRKVGYWAIILGIILIIHLISTVWNVFSPAHTTNKTLSILYYSVVPISLFSFSSIFLFLLGNRCLNIQQTYSSALDWENALVMLRNYVWVSVVVVIAWIVLFIWDLF